MVDFLAENNACGQNLLRLVSHGNSIIAELLRLKDYIPSVYRLDTKADHEKYADIILDFQYLKISEAHEKKIEANAELQELDDEIRETYLELLSRFYLVFECTHQYAIDLQEYVNELNRGYYIQHTLETVLQDDEGKQLLCEALFLFGIILLLIDFHIPGIIRERLLVSYYRYTGGKATADSRIDDVCMLLRSTGFTGCSTVFQMNGLKNNSNKAVTNYPESYFARFQFEENFIEMILGRLRCDDIYNQLSIYPHPDHRSTALASQASMLFICLYFSPKILHNQVAQMREIVDKFFADNWVVSIYMGITVNLIDAWDHFKAAKTAISSTIEFNNIKALCLLNKDKLTKTLKQTKDVLREGILTDFFVMKNISKIINLLRQCNVVLKWYICHVSTAVMEITSTAKKTVQQIQQSVITELGYRNAELFELLLNISQLELKVKEVLKDLLRNKEQTWIEYKKQALERLNELSEVFGGNRPFLKIEKNEQLMVWFKEVGQEVDQLDKESSTKSGAVLIQLTQALEDVQEFHNLQSNMQVKQYLLETLEFIEKMIQIINVKEELLVTIQVISDLSYAWRLIDRDFTEIMQSSIKKHPKSVFRLRALFLKLASALEIPLMRINQAKSEDLVSVSKCYSHELANYVRKVLQIIPETMFMTLARIIQMQTDTIKEIPIRVDKEKLKEYAQFEERFVIAKLTHSIATFTEGILMMKTTLVGVIELDPKELLEDGIRKELIKHLANALNLGLIFTKASKPKNISLISNTLELEKKLDALAKTMEGYRKSFEYVQDYLNVNGLKILREELLRLINFNVERECNLLFRNKIAADWQSEFQNQTIPIPVFPPLTGDETNSNNFIGRLAREILYCTDPKQTIYLDLKAAWYEKKSPYKEVFKFSLFEKVKKVIEPVGLVGLDRLYCHMFSEALKKNLTKLQKNFQSDQMWKDAFTSLKKELETRDFPHPLVLQNPSKFYMGYHTRWLKVWPTILDWVMGLGQNVAIRQQIAFQLDLGSRCESANLKNSLEAYNNALMNNFKTSSIKKEEDKDSITELRSYMMFIGTYDPLEQCFITPKTSFQMPLFFFLFTLAHLPRLMYSHRMNVLLGKTPKDTIDSTIMIIGLIAIFKQYHDDIILLYISYLCQYVIAMVEHNLNAKHELSLEVTTVLHYMNIFIRMAKIPKHILLDRIPAVIVDHFEYLAPPSKE